MAINKFLYAHPNCDTCTRCHQAPMRVVRSRVVGNVEKEQLACSNCDHMSMRDAPRGPLASIPEEVGD